MSEVRWGSSDWITAEAERKERAIEVGKRLNAPCTPRCTPATHALDCPRYSGPLSRTGTLSRDEDRTTGDGW